MEDERRKIEELRAMLRQADYDYYVRSMPVMSDFEYDARMRELQDLEAAHPEWADPDSPTQRVGSDLTEGFAQEEHRYPMLSLGNTYNEEEVRDFFRRTAKALDEPFEIVCELKFDGTSISLTYENGRLIRALTRGDGRKGDNVTRNVRTIRSIPLTLQDEDYPAYFEMRGEVLMPWTVFEQLNEERERQEEALFANPRNAASGTLKQLKPQVVSQRRLDAYLYYMLGDTLPAATHYDNLQAARRWGFRVSDAMRKCSTLEEVMDFIHYWDGARRDLPVATDGIVLKVNSLEQQQRLGYTAKNPRWAIAYKFQAERARTLLRSVSYQVGRTGTVTPVANLDPVQLSGTVVRRATLHNADFMRQLDLRCGDYVYVEKGGEIIPKIVGVDTDARKGRPLTEESFIDLCPECGTPLRREEDQAAWYCPNAESCPPQIKGRLEHFTSRRAMNIEGMGTETVDLLYRLGLLRQIPDIYRLRASDLNSLEGWGEKSAHKLLQAIAQSKQVPYERVLYALGIRYVGETVAKTLAQAFPSMEALRAASLEKLAAVPEIGEKIAGSVCGFFADSRSRVMVDELCSFGLQMERPAEEGRVEGSALAGKSIVISGVFARHSRDEYKDMIEKQGGKNVSSISSKTSFVLAGEQMGPSKREKAEALGVPLVGEDEFLAMLGVDDALPSAGVEAPVVPTVVQPGLFDDM